MITEDELEEFIEFIMEERTAPLFTETRNGNCKDSH